MPQYLTWDKARPRWVYQRRIPEAIRFAFDGRSTIRIHLGDIPESEAMARATLLTAHYTSLFEQHRKTKKRPKAANTAAKQAVHLLLDEDIQQRFMATWRMQQAHLFEGHLQTLSQASNADWALLESEALKSLSEAQEALRRHDDHAMREILASIQVELNVKLGGDETALRSLTHAFNGAQVKFLRECLAVIRGDTPVSELYPDTTAQLPLVSLWGDSPSQLLDRWRERILSEGGIVNPKTSDKFRNITADLELILTRRPVQALTQPDLDALRQLWLARKNGAKTIRDKFSILLSLIRPFDSDKRLESLFSHTPASARSPRATRMPFSNDQIRQFLAHVIGNHTVRQDDQMLLVLMIMLGARLEEIYQLGTGDITHDEDGWIVRIADHRQTGSGNAHLKNSMSARRLPLCRGIFPELDAWLNERLKDSGYLFPDGSMNRYGIRSDAAGKRLNRILRSIFPDDRRLVLQSTRSTANRVMRRAGTDPRIRHRVLGHADTSIHDRHYDPGEFLDDQDLKAGSNALADFLLNVLRIEDGALI